MSIIDAKDLEGKSPDQLREIARQEQKRLSQAEAVRNRDFSFVVPPLEEKAVVPVTDEDVVRLQKEADEIILQGHIVFLRARLGAVAAEAQRKIDLAKARMEAIATYGLSQEHQTKERHWQPVRQWEGRSPRERRMIKVDATCANCGAHIDQLQFSPAPGQSVYCSPCYEAKRGGRGRETGAIGQASEEESSRLRAKVQELEAKLADIHSAAPAGKSGKPSKKEQRRLHEQKRRQPDEE